MYVFKDPAERREMLAAIGARTAEELLDQVPAGLRLKGPLRLPPPVSEMELVGEVSALARSNGGAGRLGPFLGGGAYDHYVPSAVRQLLLRAEFLTAYTPYQAEVSQGTLQATFEYQSMVCELTGMEVSNASLYDGASATAEAALMARVVTGRKDVAIAGTVWPHYRRVLATYLKHVEGEVQVTGIAGGRADAWDRAVGQGTAAVVVQSPNMFGIVEDIEPAVDAARAAGALVVVVCDLLSLNLLRSPADWGADIAVGDGQSVGSALNYGGPYLGFMATRREFIRKMPGRIIAETRDVDGKRGFVMTLQTREQHIKRERATSNICTNQGLNAVAAAIHMALMGPAGMLTAAEACVKNAKYAASRLCGLPGFRLKFEGPFFREFPVETPVPPSVLNEGLAHRGICGGLDMGLWSSELEGVWLVCVTEKRTKAEIDAFVEAVREVCS